MKASRETVGMVQDAARQAVVRKLELLEAQAEELLAEDRLSQMTVRGFWDLLKKRAGIE